MECAMEIQRFLSEFNATSREDWKVRLRIGIHLGDVVRSEGDLLGDAVNIASRIEPLAEPGGICVSEQVYAQIRNKLDCPFERLGSRELKNVSSPVEVYRVTTPQVAGMAQPSIAARSRVAVLPFANISSDPQDEFFADGLTEELITELAQINGLRIIGHTSVNRFRGTKLSLAQIGKELGVGSILEGSVRKAGGTVRVTVQLIDAGTEEHAWAGTFDRPIENILEIQSEIARRVSQQLKVRILPAEERRLDAAPLVHPESYLASLRGRTFLQSRSQSALRSAKEQFERAIALDGQNARAYVGLSDSLRLLWGYYAERFEPPARSEELLRTALNLDPDLSEAHASLGETLRQRYDFAEAEREFQRAIALNPGYSVAHHWYALLCEDTGRVDEAFRELSAAERADPLAEMTLYGQVQLLIWTGRLDEAQDRLARLREVARWDRVSHWGAGQLAEARGNTGEVLKELRWLESSATDETSRLSWQTYELLARGDRGGALAVVEKIKETASDHRVRAVTLAGCYAQVNDVGESLRWLEEALSYGGFDLRQLRFDSGFASVRRDPRLKSLLEKRRISTSGYWAP